MIWVIFLVLAVGQGIIFFGHWIIYEGLLRLLHLNQFEHLPIIRWILFFLSISFVLSNILSQQFIGEVIDWLYTASAIWLGTVWVLSIVIVAGLILKALIPALNTPIFGAFIFILGFLVSAYGIYNSFSTQITSYQAGLPNLPEYWQGKKIVMVSDTHFGNVRGVKTANKIASIIQDQSPEMVLIPGDFYDGPPTDYAANAKPFGAIKAPMGIYFSTGNHEEFRDSDAEYVNAISQAGVKVLNNQMVNANGLQILGVAYRGSNNEESLLETLKKLPLDKNLPSILLKHVPQAIAGAEMAGVSLTVSGHTHRGQMWPLNYVTKWMFKGYDYGMKNYGRMVQITSSGAGTWGPPQRLGTKGEIVVITLEKK